MAYALTIEVQVHGKSEKAGVKRNINELVIRRVGLSLHALSAHRIPRPGQEL
jgi:hypothetical protein